MYIDGYCVKEFYTRLNIDSGLWKKDGVIKIGEKDIYVAPDILIGLDIIRACDFTGNRDRIELNNFDNQVYLDYCSKYYMDAMILYKNMDKPMYHIV